MARACCLIRTPEGTRDPVMIQAMRTVESERPCHSFHAYFLRPGDPSTPILYEVDRSRDGASFSVRRVVSSGESSLVRPPLESRQ